MQQFKTMFLGFLVLLVGFAWLLSIITAVPVGTSTTLNPLVAALTLPYSGITTDYLLQVAPLLQAQEAWALVLILAGLLIGVLGYFRKG